MSSAWEEVTCTKSDQPEDLPQDASADHEGLAWEISFSPGEEKKPKRPLPRFLLGEREKKQRSEQLKKDTSPKVSPPKIKSSPLKAKTTPEKSSKSPFSKPFSKPFSSSLSPKTSAKVPSPTGEKSPISRRALLPGKVWGGKGVKSPEEKRPSSAKSSKLPSHQTFTNRPSSAKSPAEIKRGSRSPQSPPVSGSQTTPPSPTRHQSPRVGKSAAHSSNNLRTNQLPSTGAGDLRTKMKESLESESSTGTGLHAELESSASCGGTVWEIDLSSFKTGKSSRQPHSKEAPPAKSSVFSRPLQPKQLAKVMLPPNEPSTSPAPTLMRTPQDMELRKVLDLRRWYCMCRPQYSRSCGLSSVISCWNYLFSTLGSGSLPPVTQEEALTLLGFQPPFGEIRFGPFTGNATVMRWFQDLCNHYGVEGQAYYFYKPVGKAKTFGIKPNMAYESLKEGLQNPSMAFVYHCLNHYFCPIGYEEIPKNAADVYKMNLPADALDSWLLIGDPSRKHPGIHCKRWEHVVKDLTCKQPEYFNIRHTERGIQTRRTKKVGGNLHCIMAFKKLEERAPMSSGGITLNFSPPQPHEDLASLVDEAASENLDSSDSDYPLTQDLDGEPSWATKLRVHSPEVWGAVDIENIDTNQLVVEEVDAPLQTHNLQTDDKTISAELSHTRSGTFTKRKEAKSDKLSSQNPPNASDDVSDEGFVLVHSAHLTTPEIQVTATLDSDEDTGSPSSTKIKRTGTFTKKRSSLSPTQQESPPSEQKTASGKVSRTGTYKKKSPSLKPSSSELSGEDSDSSVEATNLTSSPFKRSGTFTKKKPSPRAKDEADGSELSLNSPSLSHDPAALSGDELSVEATNLTSSPLKRSGTFTKKKPLLGTKDKADGSELSHDSPSLSHDPAALSGDELSVEATNLTSSPLKRSGTFTKKKPLLGARDEADGSELSHDSPSLSHDPASLSGDELSVDLDDTLKAEFPEIQIIGVSDGESSCEEAVLTSPSNLKRTGTFTKKKPLLPNSPTV